MENKYITIYIYGKKRYYRSIFVRLNCSRLKKIVLNRDDVARRKNKFTEVEMMHVKYLIINMAQVIILLFLVLIDFLAKKKKNVFDRTRETKK
jgi:hypothetical protein